MIIMPTHSTNYTNTFITTAEDCPAQSGQMPPLPGNKKSVADETITKVAAMRSKKKK